MRAALVVVSVLTMCLALQYMKAVPHMVVIDDLLNPQALANLRELCLSGTVWQPDPGQPWCLPSPEQRVPCRRTGMSANTMSARITSLALATVFCSDWCVAKWRVSGLACSLLLCDLALLRFLLALDSPGGAATSCHASHPWQSDTVRDVVILGTCGLAPAPAHVGHSPHALPTAPPQYFEGSPQGISKHAGV